MNLFLTIYRYGMQYHGQMALQVGVLVAFTQLIPEHQVQVFGVFRARVKVWLTGYQVNPRTTNLLTDTSNGIPHIFYCHVHNRFSMSIHRHPVWVAGLVDMASVL